MATLYGHVMLRMATLQCHAHLRAQLLTNDHQLFCVIRADNTVPSCDPRLLQTGVSVLCCEMCPVYIVFISVFFLFDFFQNSVCVCSDKCVLFSRAAIVLNGCHWRAFLFFCLDLVLAMSYSIVCNKLSLVCISLCLCFACRVILCHVSVA